MLNAIGLQNPGVEVFCKRDVPFLRKFDTKIIVDVCGKTEDEYCEVVERLSSEPVDMLGINISCPNIKAGGMAFGQNPEAAEAVTKAVKKYAKQPVIMKLSPNVTNIAEVAKAVEAGGADAVSLINTPIGMKIDIRRKEFVLANRTGGLSGPAIHPIAVYMVYQTAQAVKIPIIGMGGIASAEDLIEMLLAGANAVSVGTMNFHNPEMTQEIIQGIERYMEQNEFEKIADMVGIVGQKIDRGDFMLELKDISFNVQEEASKEILNNINLTLGNGKFVVITGPNGGGKSTLAKIIAGIERPASGRIYFEGTDITETSVTDRARMGIGYAFQNPIRFKGIKVKDLIRFAAGMPISV